MSWIKRVAVVGSLLALVTGIFPGATEARAAKASSLTVTLVDVQQTDTRGDGWSVFTLTSVDGRLLTKGSGVRFTKDEIAIKVETLPINSTGDTTATVKKLKLSGFSRGQERTYKLKTTIYPKAGPNKGKRGVWTYTVKVKGNIESSGNTAGSTAPDVLTLKGVQEVSNTGLTGSWLHMLTIGDKVLQPGQSFALPVGANKVQATSELIGTGQRGQASKTIRVTERGTRTLEQKIRVTVRGTEGANRGKRAVFEYVFEVTGR